MTKTSTRSRKAPPIPAATESASLPRSGNAPSHRLYHIADGAGKASWTAIAVAWVNRDGSLNLRVRAGAILLPNDDYQLRKIEPKITTDSPVAEPLEDDDIPY
jgi:hypothetical protein